MDDYNNVERKRKRRRKATGGKRRARRKFIRKLIPALVAIILIIIIAVMTFSSGMLEKLSYSKEKADLNDYFKLTGGEDTSILLNGEFIEERALCTGGRFYLPFEMAEEKFCENLYYDEHEQALFYTDGNGTSKVTEGDGTLLTKNGDRYISLDYVEQHSAIEVKTFTAPNHIEIKSSWGEIQVADVVDDTQVRVLGGVKSPILREISKGEKVEIVNPMEEWSEVKTDDGFLGYVEIKRLDNYRTEVETPAVNPSQLNITHTLRDHKICLGWHQVMSTEASLETLDSVVDRTKDMNVISPTWFSLIDNEGNISNIGSPEYVARAHEKGLEVWGLIDNFNDAVSSFEVLSYTEHRQTLINNLVSAALELGLDGINIDFETLDASCGDGFAQFIRELSIPCRQNGLVLSVDNYVPKEYTSHYNRKVQGQYADYVIIMGYDEHYAGSTESGSVASFNFVQEGIEKTLQDVDASQVINGIPFYTRVWAEGTTLSSEAVDMQTAQNFVSNHNINMVWDDACAQNYGEMVDDGITYKLWMEDAQSIQAKLNLMAANNIAGVACWKLGFETDDIWDVIASYMEGN